MRGVGPGQALWVGKVLCHFREPAAGSEGILSGGRVQGEGSPRGEGSWTLSPNAPIPLPRGPER